MSAFGQNAPARAALYLLPLLVGGAALADGEAIESLQTNSIETLQVTASAREQSVLESTAAVTVVGDRQMREGRMHVLPEALRGETGTWFQQTTPGQGTPVLRGLKGSQVLNLVDGMRLNNAFFRSAPNQYLALVDSMNVRQLEVVRGPSPTLYGHDAMGGVVNVITPTPSHAREWATSGKFYTSMDSAERLRVLHAELEANGPILAFIAGASMQNSDDRRTGRGEYLYPSAYTSRSANGKLVFTPRNGHEFMLSGQSTRQDSTPRVDELIPGYGQDTPGSEEFFFEPNTRESLHGTYTWTPSSGFLDNLQLHLARQVIEDDRRTRDYGSDLRILEQNQSTLDGLKLQAEFTPGDSLLLTLGLETYMDKVLSARQGLALDSGLQETLGPRFPDGSSMDSTAMFVHAQTALGERWTLAAGMRYSRFTIEAPASADGGFLLEPDDLTGNLSLGYQFVDGLRWSFNLGRGFRPPNIFDLGALGPRTGNRFNIANADLQPESVITLDTGLKYLSGPWELEVYLWSSQYTDQIATVPTGEVTPDGRTVVRSENINQVNLKGLESGIRYRTLDGGTVFAVLNWTYGQEYNSAGLSQPADRIPPLNGRLGVSWPLGDRLEVDAWVIFAGRQDRLSDRDTQDPRINPVGTAGWGSSNLSLRWKARENLELGFRLENLFDTGYREHGSGIDTAGINAILSLAVGY
ncbi:MAG: TonB-dependent receptor [Gammaproteobacteria bacterium]|nr:TonB-dependent receptor [Gammaproteobacteria bacterium]